MTKLLCLLFLFSFVTHTQVADPAWVPVTTELLKTEKTGFGGLCGVVVDYQTGAIWANLSDRGMFLSTDQGADLEAS